MRKTVEFFGFAVALALATLPWRLWYGDLALAAIGFAAAVVWTIVWRAMFGGINGVADLGRMVKATLFPFL